MKRLMALMVCLSALKATAQSESVLKLVRTIPLPDVAGRIDHLTTDTVRHRLFMAALGNDTVEVIDLEAGRHLQTIHGCSEPQGLFFLTESNLLFVANGGSGEMQMFDGKSFQLLQTIGSLPDADNVRYDADGNRVYVGYGEGALGLIDPAIRKWTAGIVVDGHPESFQLERAGNRIFVNVPGDRSVVVIDRKRKTVLTKWHLESAHSNFPMALDETGRRLFVGCRSPARLLALDTTSGKMVGQVEISGDTDDVFFDAKRRRLYASCGEGFLDVIQWSRGDRCERVAHQPTRGGARTCFYSSEMDRLFLAVPRRWGHDAELRIYQPE